MSIWYITGCSLVEVDGRALSAHPKQCDPSDVVARLVALLCKVGRSVMAPVLAQCCKGRISACQDGVVTRPPNPGL